MFIQEFARTRCPDIIERAKLLASDDTLSAFPYDEIVQSEDDPEAPPMRVINTENFQLPLTDILGMDRVQFAQVYPQEECLEAYDKYLAMFIITEGPAALQRIREQISKSLSHMDFYSEKLGAEAF